jgi:hypothetical protein
VDCRCVSVECLLGLGEDGCEEFAGVSVGVASCSCELESVDRRGHCRQPTRYRHIRSVEPDQIMRGRAPRISGAAVGPDCEGLPETEDGLSGVDTERLGCDVHAS